MKSNQATDCNTVDTLPDMTLDLASEPRKGAMRANDGRPELLSPENLVDVGSCQIPWQIISGIFIQLHTLLFGRLCYLWLTLATRVIRLGPFVALDERSMAPHLYFSFGSGGQLPL